MLLAALQVTAREVVRSRYIGGRILWVLVVIILVLTIAMLVKRMSK